jgi:hypothetical protein
MAQMPQQVALVVALKETEIPIQDPVRLAMLAGIAQLKVMLVETGTILALTIQQAVAAVLVQWEPRA